MGRGWVNAVRTEAGNKKGKMFTKMAREIAVAVKMGGGDNPDNNSRLRVALKEAREHSVPRETIERAVKRGMGGAGEAALEEISYEGYAPHGVAVIVETLTDNKNRTVMDLRTAFTRSGGSLGESNSVKWMFDHVSSILAKPTKAGMDPEEAAINSEANSVEEAGENVWDFIAGFADLEKVSAELQKNGWEVIKGEHSYRAKTPATITPDQEKDLRHFLELVEDSDDVKRVHLSV